MTSTRHRTERMAHSMHTISTRIALLARMLGLDLSRESDVRRVLDPQSDEGDGARQRLRHQELHALMLMRYSLASRCALDMGADATCSILLDAQARFVRSGFKPGASGADVSRLFARC